MAKVKLLDPSDPRRKLDRYELIGEIATGGMATVFLARRGGVGGFQRFVAIKRLHPHLANEPEFVEMFLDEARLAALIHHPNVVPILEVGETEAGYYLVMEYVEGDTLSRIVARTMSLGQMPPRHVILRMVLDALAGLHAAHELRDDRGQLLGLVHRDCSPQNVLVGVDGTARITDFGVARASSRLTSTAHGKLKGKLAYMAPEQTRGDELDRRTDLFAMGIILWEVLCGKRLFKADSEAATLQRILVEPIRPPSEINGAIPKCFDQVVLKSLDRNQDKRFQTAADMIDALEAAGREAAKHSVTDVGMASPREVASFVQTILGQEIGAQRESVRAWLAQSDSGQPLVIGAGGSNPPPSHRGRRSPELSGPSSNRRGGAQDLGATLPETEIDPSVAARNSPLPARIASSPVPVVPQFEVAADVTMRFALEQPKGEPPPAPASPPARHEAPPPAPPRAPPPAKQSQRTLIGQGPAPRNAEEAAAALAARKAGVPLPASGGTTQQGVGLAQAVAAAMNGVGALPKEAQTVKEGSAAAAALAQVVGSAQVTTKEPAAKYTPQMTDDLEDAVTIARPNSGPPPSAMIPAVKTARGLFAEPLLAEARARLEANGQVFDAPKEGAGSTIPRTPRMPMPAEQAGVSDPKLQAAAGAIAARGGADAGYTVPMDGAAIVGSVPPSAGLPGAGGSSRPGPRTLLMPNGEVSAGGFTPGSMTLSAEAAMRNDALDPTVVHTVRKRGYGKYIVVFAAFLLVFGTGLLLVRSRYGLATSDSDKTDTRTKKTEKDGTATATGGATTSKPQEPGATSSTAAAQTALELVASGPEASTTGSVAASNERVRGPSVSHGGTSRTRSTKGETNTSPPPPPPPPPPPAGTQGEDLSNPYR